MWKILLKFTKGHILYTHHTLESKLLVHHFQKNCLLYRKYWPLLCRCQIMFSVLSCSREDLLASCSTSLLRYLHLVQCLLHLWEVLQEEMECLKAGSGYLHHPEMIPCAQGKNQCQLHKIDCDWDDLRIEIEYLWLVYDWSVPKLPIVVGIWIWGKIPAKEWKQSIVTQTIDLTLLTFTAFPIAKVWRQTWTHETADGIIADSILVTIMKLSFTLVNV